VHDAESESTSNSATRAVLAFLTGADDTQTFHRAVAASTASFPRCGPLAILVR
jgi:hypothetical protein